ncbi:MAG: GtrA family protein [Gammaproteobacteria bacterium]|jgi:putative flippase GtrA|nr:GtrA family protein [Gammaproteobacteria bacterium]MBT4491765.1 GtrA family protein [Gammaproteobacteria bacterium]MBT7371584.1 GtrA family protein [Gammaproteobacteria bacterium]
MNLPKLVQTFFRSEFFRYGISGVIAFIFDFTVLVTGTEILGLHYLVSNIGGYAVGLLVSYTINVRWVFVHRRYAEKQTHEFVYFTSIVIVGLAISEFVLYAATETVGLHYTLSKVVATVFIFLFNFVVKKWLLFS